MIGDTILYLSKILSIVQVYIIRPVLVKYVKLSAYFKS